MVRGTRLQPLTYTTPKPLLPFCGAPFLSGVIRRLAAAGIQRVFLVVGAETEPFDVLKADGAALGVEVEAVPEPEPLDTAGGVRSALDKVDGAFLVLNGDILTDVDLPAVIEAHETASADATDDVATNDSERDLLVLQESYEHKQIPVESLRCNPFLPAISNDVDTATSTASPASSELLRARRMEELEDAVTELVIDSTLTGSRPMARIGGELVMQGDTLVETPSGIVVTLVHVDRGSVTIRASDPALELSGQWQRSVGR